MVTVALSPRPCAAVRGVGRSSAVKRKLFPATGRCRPGYNRQRWPNSTKHSSANGRGRRGKIIPGHRQSPQ